MEFKNLSRSSINVIQSALNKFKLIMGYNLNPKTLTKEEVDKFLLSFENVSTKKNKIWSINAYLKQHDIKYDWLNNLYKECQEEEMTVRLDRHRNDVLNISWEDIITAREKLNHSSKEYLIISLFTKMPPLRKSEWDVYTIEVKDGNYIKDKKIYINRTKTTKRVIDIPDDLWNDILVYRSNNSCEKFCLINNYNTIVVQVCKDFLSELGVKKPSLNTLRHLYITTHGTNTYNCEVMGHSAITSIIDYEKTIKK